MKRERRHGLLHIASEGFCQSCLPYPQGVITAVNSRLPEMALRKNEDLLTIIKVGDELLIILYKDTKECLQRYILHTKP